jgi:hypothetical protein
MKTMLVLPRHPKKTVNTSLLPLDIIEKIEAIFLYLYQTDVSRATLRPYYKFYKVDKNDTAVTEVSTNDFKPFGPTYLKIKAACNLHSAQCLAFALPADPFMFYGYLSRIKAMEKAKAGAIKYIDELIEGSEQRYGELLKYREDHYYDLNFNLTERNIRMIEADLKG